MNKKILFWVILFILGVVRVPSDNAVLKDLSEFTEGSKVKIIYDGMIMESYPAQINAYSVEFIR